VAVAVLGLVAAVGVWFSIVRSTPDPTIGGGVKPPPCAEPGARDTVGPQPWVAYRFRIPECFQSGEGVLEKRDDSGAATRLIVLPIELSLEPGQPVDAQIAVSAVQVSANAANGGDESAEEGVRRAFGGIPVKQTARRSVDGARGLGFRLGAAPPLNLVAWVFIKGTTQVNVVCRWVDTDLDARMLAGCNQLIDSLTIA
jgi:hypothetical protein